MVKVNFLAVIVAAATTLAMGALWYSPLLFGDEYLALRGIAPGAVAHMTPVPAQIVAEFGRCLVVAYVLARFVTRFEVASWLGAIQLGAWVWIGFQAMAIAGSVIHESYPWQLYAIHSGDALVKTLAACAILGRWRRQA